MIRRIRSQAALCVLLPALALSPATAQETTDVAKPASEPAQAPAEPVERQEPVEPVEPATAEPSAEPVEQATAEPSAEPQPAAEPAERQADLPPERHYELAHQAHRQQDLDTALYHFEKAVAAEPNHLRWGTEYRQVAIEAEAYDRCIEFFGQLAKQHPELPNLFMNYGYAHVDKIPAEGAITQVILANTALTHFSRSLELKESWLGYYTRGNSYMFWPAIFGRTPNGIADLEKAIALAEEMDKKPYHGRAWAALGDGYWRLDDRDKMVATWQKGQEMYPDTPELEERLARQGQDLDAFLEKHFETGNRVATHLKEIWAAGGVE